MAPAVAEHPGTDAQQLGIAVDAGKRAPATGRGFAKPTIPHECFGQPAVQRGISLDRSVLLFQIARAPVQRPRAQR